MIKNKFILKSLSLFLSFWMLLASTGFSVSYHYCEGEIVNWSILTDADNCDHEEKEVKSCCELDSASVCSSPIDAKIDKSDCCRSDQAKVVLESEFNTKSIEVELSLPQLIILAHLFSSFSGENNQDKLYRKHEEPILLYKIEPSYIQSFLI